MASGMVTIPFRRMASVVRCGRRRCPISAMPPWYHLGVLSSWPTFVPAGVSLSFARWLLVAVGHATTAGERAGATGQVGEDVADRPGPHPGWSENRTFDGRAAASGGALRRRTWVSGSGGCGQQFAGDWVDGLDGDLVAEAFEAADVVAGLAAGVHALFVVAGAEVLVGGGGV